jgi:hypothetical protein
MTPPSNTPLPVGPPLPVCPYCEQDPADMRSIPLGMGPLKCLVVYCSNPACRKIFAVQVLGMEQPMVMPSGLIRPC